jgi:hypothetical protein
MRTSGKKVAIETEKFQYLGEISTLTHFVYELEDQESTLSTEGLFSQIYQCYEQLFEFASKKELIIKYSQIKQARKTT